MLFCLQGVGLQPANLFDIPDRRRLDRAGVSGRLRLPLMYKLLGLRSQGRDARLIGASVRSRDQQIEYALDSVRYLEPMRDKLASRLTELGRMSWLADEMTAWQSDVEATRSRERQLEDVRAFPASLAAQHLAVVRTLAAARPDRARNSPPRRACATIYWWNWPNAAPPIEANPRPCADWATTCSAVPKTRGGNRKHPTANARRHVSGNAAASDHAGSVLSSALSSIAAKRTWPQHRGHGQRRYVRSDRPSAGNGRQRQRAAALGRAGVPKSSAT